MNDIDKTYLYRTKRLFMNKKYPFVPSSKIRLHSGRQRGTGRNPKFSTSVLSDVVFVDLIGVRALVVFSNESIINSPLTFLVAHSLFDLVSVLFLSVVFRMGE
jgi:hypothetical protein